MKTMNYFAVLRALTGCDGVVDVASMERGELCGLAREIARGRATLAALESEVAARLTEIDCASIAEATFAKEARLSPSQARGVVLRAETLEAMPGLGCALEDGVVTPEHVDVVARAVKKLGDKKGLLVAHEGRLLAQAAVLSVPRFARFVENLVATLDRQTENDVFEKQRCSTQVKMWEDHRTGMIRLSGEFDPERGSRLWTVLDAAVERIFHSPAALDCGLGIDPNDHRRGLALCHLVEAGASAAVEQAPGNPRLGDETFRPQGEFRNAEGAESTGAGTVETGAGFFDGAGRGPRVNTEIIVTIDLETLLHGIHEGSVRRNGHGATLPVDVIRRMACDAGLVPMVLNGDGVVVDVGRAKRLATRRQRQAIFAMHETCAVPHCGVKVKHCVPHHIDWWERGGGTDLDNLVPLCSRHHHKVHEGGWGLSMDESRRVTVTRPTGGGHD